MIVVLDDKALVSPLPDMTAGAVMSVITADMTCHQPLHPFGKLIGMLRLDEQMEMVWHKAPCVNLYRIFFPCLEHKVDKSTVVGVLMKDLLPTVTAIDEVIEAVVR